MAAARTAVHQSLRGDTDAPVGTGSGGTGTLPGGLGLLATVPGCTSGEDGAGTGGGVRTLWQGDGRRGAASAHGGGQHGSGQGSTRSAYRRTRSVAACSPVRIAQRHVDGRR